MCVEFCNCVPSKFLNIPSLSRGDVEEIGKVTALTCGHTHGVTLMFYLQVVVIFLCMAVQKKPNEDIIAGIKSLDTFVQHDIRFFIENTLGRMETDALMRGEFTSRELNEGVHFNCIVAFTLM